MTAARRVVIAEHTALAAEFRARVEAALRDARSRGDDFTVAIPGGSAAEQLLPSLAIAELPWNHVHLFWCDERAVPPDNADSNLGVLRRLWSGTAALANVHVHPMPAADPERDTAAGRYAQELESVCGVPPVIDVALLGVGEDGHIASLFPNDASFATRAGSVTVVRNAPKPPPDRMSLTMAVLERARLVIVAAFGATKARVMRDALTPDAAMPRTPAAHIIHAAGSVLVLLDASAGADLAPELINP